MKPAYFPIFRSFFLFTALLAVTAGCGSDGSTDVATSSGVTSATSETSSATNIDTGSIAVKLVWNANNSSSRGNSLAKVLYALPADVVKVKIIVSGPGILTPIESPLFDVAAGSGTLSGIPAGIDRVVTAQGLNTNGIVSCQGTTSNIAVNTGTATPVSITMVDVLPPTTTVSLSGRAVNAGQIVTLTANEPATIFYTTNGNDPSTPGSPSGPHTGVDITISSDVTLKFFAVDTAGNQETTKTENYTINIGSLTITF
ncbi:MAG TPA: chitobiase/beta-hexosaminidase C-terminal domain-containing protein [Dongiaceae bacterium]|nr:chitobiase/beta-hexosaminidase C-terminal domain-containing protein [Dongiaceae bacterium]